MRRRASRADARGPRRARARRRHGLDPRLATADDHDHVGRQQSAAAASTARRRSSARRKACAPATIAALDATHRALRGARRARVRPARRGNPGAGAAGGLGFALQLIGGAVAIGRGGRRRPDRTRRRARRRRLGDHRRRPQRRADAAAQGAVRSSRERAAARRVAGHVALGRGRPRGAAGAGPPFRRLLRAAVRAGDARANASPAPTALLADRAEQIARLFDAAWH